MSRRDAYDDERVVIVEEGSTNAIGMLLLGLAVGAGAALLFAPASGEETRQRIRREARRATTRVKEMTDEVTTQFADKVDRTRAGFDERVERARNAVRSRTRAVGDAVEAGREGAADARADLERAVADSKRAYADSRRAYREARRQGLAADAPVSHELLGEGTDSADSPARDG